MILRSNGLSAHFDISIRTKGLKFGPSFHIYPYFVYASSNGFCESAHVSEPLLIL